jgi:hypothetical protein
MLNDPTLEAFLERLHVQSRGQSREIDEHSAFDGGFEFSVKCG